jgi:hypothetical protein
VQLTCAVGLTTSLEANSANLQVELCMGKLQIRSAKSASDESVGGEPLGRHLASFSSRVQLISQRAQFTCRGGVYQQQFFSPSMALSYSRISSSRTSNSELNSPAWSKIHLDHCDLYGYRFTEARESFPLKWTPLKDSCLIFKPLALTLIATAIKISKRDSLRREKACRRDVSRAL